MKSITNVFFNNLVYEIKIIAIIGDVYVIRTLK